MFPALAPTGGQFFLQQQGSGGFQLIVRPPVPSSSPPKQQSIVMQPQIGQTVHLAPNRPATVAAVPPPCHPTLSQQPMVRLVTLPGLGTVQLQQIQTPNGPAFLAVQQPQQQQPQPQTVTQQPATFLRTTNQPTQPTFIQQHHVIQQQQHQPHIVTQQQPQPHILTQQQQQQQQTQQQQHQHQQETIRLVSNAGNTLIGNEVVNDGVNHRTTTFATPPSKKQPAKKKPKPKKKKEEVNIKW